ncbi:MAG: single-stranded-DNA-specific exonuclease RecJ [Bacteroidetes bacterium]|nr:MAG: single-stranded-DNA-specific exonuclease RecJ [Bacteroidota bacterium]
MKNRWTFKPLADSNIVQNLIQSIHVSTPIAHLLAMRGIKTYEEAKSFFRPSLDHLHDPFLMKDMDKAVKRLNKAMNVGEKILIYGDYDVDGTTSVALVYGFLSKYYNKLDFYTPDRYAEGYGVSFQGMDWAKEREITLVISLDCGIKSAKQIDYAKTLGIDFIICDHHKPEELPNAFAILDPKRKDCNYPFDELSGCGVGFKLLQALCQTNGYPVSELFKHLDLLALSIAADLVPITGENRVLTYFGIQKINSGASAGIEALIEIAAVKKPLNVSNVVFGLAPRINAVGRISHANNAIRLLFTEDLEQAKVLASSANIHNTDRKSFDQEATKEAILMIEEQNLQDNFSTVLFKKEWHKGIIGIVASRCIEKYHRPTIILTESHGKAAGSARSIKDFDVYEAIGKCEDLLEQFGGHKYAAGLSMSIDKIPDFQKKFELVVSQMIEKEQLIPQIEVDLLLNLNQITPQFYKVIEQMSPFGPLNMQPIFVSQNLDVRHYKVLKEKHLKITVSQNGVSFDAIGFGIAEEFLPILEEKPYIDLCYSIEENDFNGKKSLQLKIRDLR